jgi:hypothetical protein
MATSIAIPATPIPSMILNCDEEVFTLRAPALAALVIDYALDGELRRLRSASGNQQP